MKNIISVLVLSALSISVFAQSGTNSPYSQYGLGVLTDQGNSFNRGMNGVGIAMSKHDQVNYLNPASYSQIDSLSFIFDTGLSLQITNFEEKGVKKNAKNADFEYAVGGFRLAKRFGLAFGVIPFSNIGYNYSNSGELQFEGTNTITTYTNSFTGSGGIHEVFVGVGVMPVKGFSVGVNGGYLWGDINKSISNSYSDGYINSLTKTYAASVGSYKLDFGFQYAANISKNDVVTIGATYGVGHKLGADMLFTNTSTNSQTSVVDEQTFTAADALELPTEIAAGMSYTNGKLLVGADYSLQKWGDVEYPAYKEVGGIRQFVASKGLFSDRQKYNVGAEYCPNPKGRSVSSRIRYRLGVSYTSPYLKINNVEGPKEISLSCGFAIPVINAYNNRSILNISAQWVNASSKNLITENTFRINVGFTFNERWFAKWKFE